MIPIDNISSEVGIGQVRPEVSPGNCRNCEETHVASQEDKVSISETARLAQASASSTESVAAQESQLSQEEQAEVNRLKRQDEAVKAHERAHMAAGGEIVSGPASYQYQRGPDGKQYAVSGEVQIDVSKERDPEETIRKMQQVRKAALAPAQPSPTDRRVAAQASQIEAEARAELTKEKEDSAQSAPETTPDILSPPIDQNSQKGEHINLMA